MRKYVIPALLFFLPGTLLAQPNNLYDQAGVDYVNSLEMIKNDFYAGKATDFSEATLNYYSRRVPLKNQVSVEMAASIVNTMKSPGFSYTSAIDNSSLSPFSRNFLKEVINNDSHLDDMGYRANLEARTNDVMASALPAAEKEFVLSLVAVAYHIADPVTRQASASGREFNCWITGPYGSGPATRAQCIAAGALLGGVLGYSICGVLCGIGGAIIGGVAGALS